MSEVVESAIQQIKPLRGRRPIELKGGKLLAEARAEAKERVGDTKQLIRGMRKQLIDERRLLRDAARRSKAAQLVYDKVSRQNFASIIDRRAAIVGSKAELRAAKTAEREAATHVAHKQKALAAAGISLTKAELARVSVEDKYQKSKLEPARE
jgi:hypothetical protein